MEAMSKRRKLEIALIRLWDRTKLFAHRLVLSQGVLPDIPSTSFISILQNLNQSLKSISLNKIQVVEDEVGFDEANLSFPNLESLSLKQVDDCFYGFFAEVKCPKLQRSFSEPRMQIPHSWRWCKTHEKTKPLNEDATLKMIHEVVQTLSNLGDLVALDRLRIASRTWGRVWWQGPE